ncbi:50S ribosomal protein L23 [Candidatus Woesearchaeota archaeon]|nr:50S ribosomal protein L23 [Candidatus Woesearchaeota archaeon]
METEKVIKYPLSTEKSIRLMDSENKLVFVVNKKAKKSEIKKAVEEMFKARVDDVNTLVGPDGEKRAYVKFNKETPAINVATKLGLM